MSALPLRRKHVSPFEARSAPVLAALGREIYMGWTDPESEAIRLSRTRDLRSFDDVIALDFRPLAVPAMTVGRSSLVLAWPDRETDDVMVLVTRDGLRWRAPVRLPLRTSVSPGLVYADGQFWLVTSRRGDGRLLLSQSVDGQNWQPATQWHGSTESAPVVVRHRDRLLISWIDADTGWPLLQAATDSSRAPAVIDRGRVTAHTLYDRAGQLYAAWSDASTGEIAVVCQAEDGRWDRCSTLHERTVGPPAMISLGRRLALAWTRDDSPDRDSCGHVTVAVDEPADGATNSCVFVGNVRGHPTALDPNHLTPYPYLGVIVLPADLQLPKGQTPASLVAAMGTALAKVRDFWAEASYRQVDISFDVHPQVVALPSPISTYVVRARPKIVEGNGVTFPVNFQGGESLVLEGSADYSVTTIFPSGQRSLDQVVADINLAIEATAYAGPADAKPRAARSDIGQLRLQTSGHVDAGTILNITGGTAVGLLGLGVGDVMTYEGSRTQEKHLDLLLRDALRAVVAGRPDPMAFLAHYFGVVVSIASNVGWYTLRASAEHLTVSVVDGADAYKSAQYFMTTVDDAATFVHETGHNLGLPDLYEDQGGPRFVGAEPADWDVMDSSPLGHPTAWCKSVGSSPRVPAARWMVDSQIAVLTPEAQSLEAIVIPNESPFPGTNPFAQSHPGVPICHAIKIPFDEDHALFVENRQRGPFSDPALGAAAFSTQLPGDGLILTDGVNDVIIAGLQRSNVTLVQPLGLTIAEVPDTVLDAVWAATSTADKLFVLAAYVPSQIPSWLAAKLAAAASRAELSDSLRIYQDDQVRSFYPVKTMGQEVVLYQFPDGSGDIRVKILEIIGGGRPQAIKVRATWGRPGQWFDLAIRKWESPPPYESQDIWIDSQENGWDTYQHHDASLNPDVPGNPILNGDRPWVGHENRVHARVWNRGDIAQNNVRVTFEEVVPPGQSHGYPFDTDYVNIPAGGYAVASGTWTPLVAPPDEHACISATVEYRPWDLAAHVVGELNADNNSAQENISDFYLAKGSPYQPVSVAFEFANPLPDTAEMKVNVSGLKPGWSVTASPYLFSLAAGERIEGEAILQADETVPLEDPAEGYSAPVVSLEALVQTGCTWQRIGGFSMIGHTVRKASLDAGVDPTLNGVHVTADATTDDGPIAGANVATRVLGPSRETLNVTLGVTDQAGHIHLFIPIELAHNGVERLSVEVRLSPAYKTGPASAVVPFAW